MSDFRVGDLVTSTKAHLDAAYKDEVFGCVGVVFNINENGLFPIEVDFGKTEDGANYTLSFHGGELRKIDGFEFAMLKMKKPKPG